MKELTATNDSQVKNFKKEFFTNIRICLTPSPVPIFTFSRRNGCVDMTALELCRQQKARSVLLMMPGRVMPEMTKEDYIDFIQMVRDRAEVL